MRRRLYAAILIIVGALFSLAWVDSRLLLRNEAELDTRARLLLVKLFPDFQPTIKHIELDLPSRVVIQGLALSDKSGPLIEVREAQLTFSLSDWLAPKEVSIEGLSANIRLGKDGKLNVLALLGDSAPAGERKPLQLSSAVTVNLLDARITFQDENTGACARTMIGHSSVIVDTDGTIKGEGIAKAGALVAPSSKFAEGGQSLPGEDKVFVELIREVQFELIRKRDETIAVPLELRGVTVGPVIRTLLPKYVQEEIWDELCPEGTVEARATLRLGGSIKGLRPEININVKNGRLLLAKKFPYPMHDIKGRFEVAPGMIGWEETSCSLEGKGRVTKARGAWFLGEDQESVSLFCSIDATDIPFDETLRKAMPDDIRGVYDQFLVQGVCGRSRINLFKGSDMKEAGLSVTSELDGRQSAAFVDYPVRFTAEKGVFRLMQGGNVEVQCDGSLAIGGHAHVNAKVVHGDLIHVVVDGEDVPVNAAMVSKLDTAVRRIVEPFRPESGTAGFHVVVDKTDPTREPLPNATVMLHGVTVSPDVFPYRLRTDGKVKVNPILREGAKEPEIHVDLALEATSPAISSTKITGSILLDPDKEDPFQGEILVRAERVEIDPVLVRSMPPALKDVIQQISPRGGLKHVKARVKSLSFFSVSGEGDLLTAALEAFPYRTAIDTFSITRAANSFVLSSVEGRTVGGGRFSLDGRIELPEIAVETPEPGAPERSRDEGPIPLVQAHIRAKGVAVEPSLIAALPDAARRTIEKLEPHGGALDADLSIGIAPFLPIDLSGSVELRDTNIRLDLLDPNLEGLEGQPVEGLAGRLRLDGERLWIDGLRARFRGSPVTVGGSVAMGAAAEARQGDRPTLDLVAHVGALSVDFETRKLARGAVVNVLQKFPVDGKCDLDFRLRALPGAASPGLSVRVLPLGVSVRPKLLPFPFENVRGTIEIQDGEPSLLDIEAKVGKANVTVLRDRHKEAFAPDGTLVFRVSAKGLDPKELEVLGPPDVCKTIQDFALAGLLDVGLVIAVPKEERGKSRFLAELRAHNLKLTAGLVFEDIAATARIAGSVGKIDAVELEGVVNVEKASWKKQDIRDAKIPIRFREGLLSIGTPREPFVATLYGGKLRGRVDSRIKDSSYTGYIFLEKGQVPEVAIELARLQEAEKGEPKSGGTDPMKGDVTASLTFRGGGTGQDGQPLGISGEGVLQVTEASLVRVPFVLGTTIKVFVGAAKGETALGPTSFDRLYTKLRLEPGEIKIDLFRMDSDTITLAGRDGRLQWDGDVSLDLLPYKSRSIFDDLFKQFVGIQIRGKISDPNVYAIPFSNALGRAWQSLKEALDPEDTPRVGETQPRK